MESSSRSPTGRRRPGKRWSKRAEQNTPEDPVLQGLQGEAQPESDGGMATVEEGLRTLMGLLVEQAGEVDEKEAADVCVNMVVTGLHKRLRGATRQMGAEAHRLASREGQKDQEHHGGGPVDEAG
eukprot:COSAG05_NODE_428_length_9890_cov_4.534470_6_plen_125_part_00